MRKYNFDNLAIVSGEYDVLGEYWAKALISPSLDLGLFAPQPGPLFATFNGTAGDDILTGTAGDDILIGGAGNDIINGGDGLDIAVYTSSVEVDYRVLDLGNGDYYIRDLYSDEDGLDLLTAIETLRFGGINGTDFAITALATTADVTGTSGDDTLTASSGDIVSALAGNDIITGSNLSYAEIYAGAGEDTLNIDWAEDSLVSGGAGDDTFNISFAFDAIYLGGAGNDIFRVENSFGTIQEFTFDGGDGDDDVEFSFHNATSADLSGGTGIDILRTSMDFEELDTINRFGGTIDITNNVTAGNYSELTLSGGFEVLIATGGGETDTLRGGSGNDVLEDGGFWAEDEPGSFFYGNGGNDSLYGMAGDDVIIGTGGQDILSGGDGDDVITSGGHYVRGFTDSFGGSFSETIISHATMIGGQGDDIFNSSGDDTLEGGEGDDTLINHSNTAVAIYSSANTADYIIRETAVSSEYTVQAIGGTGEGKDLLIGVDVIRLGGINGTDYDITTLALMASGGTDLTNGDDTYTSTDNEVVNGLDGNDTLTAGGFGSTLNGDGGDDILNDNFRDQTLFNGGIGADNITVQGSGSTGNGGDGDDFIRVEYDGSFGNGDAGNDTISVRLWTASFMTLDGGTGTDSLVLRYDDFEDTDGQNRYGGTLDMSTGMASGDYNVTISGFESLDFVGGGETDNVTGGAGNDIIEDGGSYSFFDCCGGVFYGLGNDDTIYGMAGDDIIIGTGGTDFLDGGDGNDTITSGADFISGVDDPVNNVNTQTVVQSAATMNGGAGDDTIISFGDDTIDGGTGDDVIIMGRSERNTATTTEGGAGIDEINFSNLDPAEGGGAAKSLLVVDLQGQAYSLRNTGTNTVLFIDTFGVFENVTGSEYRDVLQGDALDNVLQGLGGDDNLQGRAGNDTAVYASANVSDYTYTETAPGEYMIVALATNEGTDTLTGIQTIRLGGVDGTDYDIATLVNAGGTFDLTPGNDVFTGTVGDDIINALAGDDMIFAIGGNDILNGGTGADMLDGGAGNDTATYIDEASGVNINLRTGTVSGAAAGDSYVDIENITGTDFDDIITGDFGNNILTGGLGIDTLDGDQGNDELHGGDGDDTLNGGDGVDSLYGDAGNDILNGGDGADVLYGGDGNDTLTGGPGNLATDLPDHLFGEAGNDTLNSGGNDTVGDVLLVGGEGDDIINGTGDMNEFAVFSSANTADYEFVELAPGQYRATALNGNTDGIDILNDISFVRLGGVNGTDYDITTLLAPPGPIDLTNGDDFYTGTSGDDIVNGLDGNDIILGEDGNDTLNGDAGNDILRGGNGNDILNGGDGDDTLLGESGSDMFDGGAGTDTVSYNNFGDEITIDMLTGTASDGASGDIFVSIENITGSAFRNILRGDSNDNVLTGGDVNDTLQGRNGNDTLIGGFGDDDLNGGRGEDILFGQEGDDMLTGRQSTEVDDDYAVYLSADPADYIVTYLGGITYTVEAVGFTGEGTDTLVSIEFIRLGGLNGTDYDISMFPDANGDISLTNGDDVFSGTAADEVINGLDGNDIIDGGAGNNTLNGDEGNDTLISLGNDILNGGTGNDLVEMGGNVFDAATATDGGADLDTISFSTLAQLPSGNLFLVVDLQGQAYSVRDGAAVLYVDSFTNFEFATGSEFGDLLQGDALNNTLSGLGGDDHLQGRDGNDRLDGGAGADILNGGAGTDVAVYTSALMGVTALMTDTASNTGDAAGDSYIDIENLTGSAFDDILGGDIGANVINGGAGQDIASYAYASAAIIYDGLGLVTASGEVANDTLSSIEGIIGTDFNDRLFGDNGASVFYGGEGADRLFGRNGDDELYGEGGDDIILGGRDNDLIDGGAGNDQLRGNEGDDTLLGGDGNDVLAGGAGADVLNGGAGIDRVEYTYGTNAGVTASLGNSAINTGDAAGDTYVDIENLYGTSFNDTLFGDAGNNRIDGRLGDDVLFGGDGNDYLIGGAGDDVLNGEAGNDLFLGQAGADIYQFDGSHGTDRIVVFAQGEDLIEFTEGVFDFSGLTVTQDGAHVNIVSSEGTIIVNNSLVADFTSEDFIFASPPSQEPLGIVEQDMAMFVDLGALL